MQQDNANCIGKGADPPTTLAAMVAAGARGRDGLVAFICRIFDNPPLPTRMDTAAITAHIELNTQVRFGKPVVKGTRTTVAEVLEMLANGMSAADIAEDFPAIGAAQVRACLLYAAYKESIVLLAAA